LVGYEEEEQEGDGQALQDLSRRWLRVVQEAEFARQDADGNLLAPEVAPALAAVENVISIWRFLANGTNPDMLAKKKRTVLLFHHTLANASEADELNEA